MAQARQQSSVTLLEVCKTIREDSGWGTRETYLMKSVTPADYQAAIRAATGADLKLLLLQSRHFLKNRGMYDSHFGSATQSFLAGCQAIVQSEPGERLSSLIRDLFNDAGMESELTASTMVAAPVGGPVSGEPR